MSSKTEHGTLPTKQQLVVEKQQEEQLKEAQILGTPEGQTMPQSTPPPNLLEHPSEFPSGKLESNPEEVL